MAENHSPLSQLADISEPAINHSFALAPLYWVLLGLLVLTLLYLAIRAYQRYQYFAAKREALLLLEHVSDAAHPAGAINTLLKRVLAQYQPGHPALSVSTAKWQQWLSQQHDQPLPDLTQLLYQPGANTAATAQYQLFARCWLQRYQGKAPWPCAETQHA